MHVYFVVKAIIQQYLQNEHYALWEVIEFGDSCKAPPEETCKARTTLLLALPDEHQLRFSKYETAQELWEAILKTFGGNEATKKTKKNQLKQQYGNFKAEDDLNQKFLTSLAPEWLMYTIDWRNKDDLDTMSLDDVYNHLKVYEPEVQKKSESNSQNMAFISSSNTSSRKGEVHTASVPTASTQVSTASTDVAATSLSHDTVYAYIASQSNGSQIKYEDITQTDEDDIGEMDIKSYMANEEENHALVADDEVPTEFALMAKLSLSSENEVYDDSYYSKSCRKNTENLNTKIRKLNEKLSDCETDLYHYKRGLSQVEARLVEFKEQEIKFCEKIKGLKRDVEFPPHAQVYSPPKKDFSWTGLTELVDDTVTDYSSVWVHKGETWPKNNYTYKSMTPRAVLLKPAHLNVRRPFQGKSTVRTQPRVSRVSTVTKKFPTVDSKFSTAKSTFTAGLGNKGKAVKASACWI
nr:ribonuclease H-like domain-containing protein [Tanacetum cinerariifolium]